MVATVGFEVIERAKDGKRGRSGSSMKLTFKPDFKKESLVKMWRDQHRRYLRAGWYDKCRGKSNLKGESSVAIELPGSARNMRNKTCPRM